MAVLDFCHLFGSYDDDLHWKNVIDNPDKFKDELLKKLGMDDKNWAQYWKLVKDYRNKDVAHLEIRPMANIPNMEAATTAVVFYYSSVIRELKSGGKYAMFLDNLSDYFPQLEKLTGAFIQQKVSDLFAFVDAT
jgi:hypothetical protein